VGAGQEEAEMGKQTVVIIPQPALKKHVEVQQVFIKTVISSMLLMII
jgi:hypothetical protein